MCDPVTIAGAALSGASMLANNAAESRVVKARNSAMSQERERQKQLGAEADALNAQSQGRYGGFEGKQNDKTAELAGYFTGQNQGLPQGMEASGAPTETIPTGGSSNIVTQEIAKQKGKAKQYGDQQGRALAGMRGFGDLLADTSRLQGRDAAQIGTIGSFMRGSSGVLPFELEAANSKGAGLQTLGGILGGAGQIGISAGLGGASDNLFGTTNNVPVGGYGPYAKTNPANGPLKGSGNIFNMFS